MRVLLTGASGFLGHYLAAELRRRRIECVRGGRQSADVPLELGEPGTIDRVVRDVRPDRVLHAAALTSVAGCESAPDLAHAVNRAAVESLSRECGSGLLLVSTDQVFAGDRAPYAADDAPSPRNVYGRSKRDAELATLSGGGTVARIPLLFGRSFDGKRGATDMIRSAAGSLNLYTNELRTPLHVADCARGLADVLLGSGSSRVVHLAGRERISRYDFGVRFAQVARLAVVIEPAECTDPLRPSDVSLVSERDCGRDLEAALRDS